MCDLGCPTARLDESVEAAILLEPAELDAVPDGGGTDSVLSLVDEEEVDGGPEPEPGKPGCNNE